MSMDGAILPINFYCRNARLCLKKAALSKKSHLYADEVQHLKAFETLVLSTIPGHPLYPERKEEKPILELRLHLHDAKKRIAEIEGKGPVQHLISEGNVRLYSSSGNTGENDGGEGIPCKALRNTGEQNSETVPPKSKRSGSPQKLQRSVSKPRDQTPFGSSPVKRLPGTGEGRREINPRSRLLRGGGTRSADTTPFKQQRNRSPVRMSARSDIRVSLANSQNKIRRLQRQRAESPRDGQRNPKMNDAYAFASKASPSPRSKSTPILQRLRNDSECDRTKEKAPAAKVATSLSREGSPFRERNPREMPRTKALGLVSATIAGKAPSKATVNLRTSRSDNCSSPVDLMGGSEDDEHECEEGRMITPDGVQMSSPLREEEEFVHSGSKDLTQTGGNCHRRASPGRYPSHSIREKKDSRKEIQSPDQTYGHHQKPYSAVAERGEDLARDEPVLTTLRFQDQFGESLKESSPLHDGREGGAGQLDNKGILRAFYQQRGPSPLPWKLGAHVKGERVHETDDEEAYFQRRRAVGSGELDHSGRCSSITRACRKKGNGERRLHYGEDADNLELFNAPDSNNGSDSSGKEDGGEQGQVVKELYQADPTGEQKRTPARFQDQKRNKGRSTKKGSLERREAPQQPAAFSSEGGGDDEQCHPGRTKRSPPSGMEQYHFRHHNVERKGGEGGRHSKNKNKTSNSGLPMSPVSGSSSSSSSSSYSLSSLPLSHYTQKLKQLGQDSKFPPSPARANIYTSKPSKFAPGTHHHSESGFRKALDGVDSKGGGSDACHSAHPSAILLPKSPPSSYASLSARIQQRLGHLTNGKYNGSDQTLDAVLGDCSLLQSHVHRSRDSSQGRDEKDGIQDSVKGHKYRHSAGDGHNLVSYISQKPVHGEKQNDVLEGSIASLQRLVGELKGSVEGLKIRIQVESEGWRGRVEGLEKELEILKDETDDELMELKKSIRSEVKVRMSELAADVERIRRDERDQVENLVQERIESHLSGSNNAPLADLKKELRTLWAEVENLTKGREDIHNQMSRLTQMSDESRENNNREIRNLKRDFLGTEERSDWTKDTEVGRTERAEIRHAMEKLKDEGLDMKMEVNGLKKTEKVVKTEMENIRKLVEKMQEDTEEMERDRGTAHMEGVRERLLIMERVESLSQLYLGGLEEVRTDVYNVKFSCRDRMDELERQWGEYKRRQETGPDDDHYGLQKQRLLNEMELFRSEIADMMETERGHLRETLKTEHESIRRQMMDMSTSTKNDLNCMMKLEVQKRVQASKDKVVSVADPMEKDMDRLRLDLEEAQHGAEAVSHALALVEKEREMAARAAAEATTASEKAGQMLADLLGPMSQEMATIRRKSLALQDTLSLDKDAVVQAFAEAKKMHSDFQQFMEEEKLRLRTSISLVNKERDSAATAASEASTSAVKAGEVLAEVLGSFNQEMSKARRKSYQLQEGLERERENLERDQEEVLRKSQQSQEKFNEELERAITAWKRAMNQEVAKAKGIIEGLEDDRHRLSINMEQSNGHTMIDHAHIAKTQEVLANLKTTVKKLQETTEYNQEEKQRQRKLKLDMKLRKDQDQKIEITSLRQRIDEAIKQEQGSRDIVSESVKRIKKLETMHSDLALSFQEIRVNTGDLQKTAAIWLPEYENAARIVNEINNKVESLEERCKKISASEGLMQQVAHVAESKVQSLQDIVGAGIEIQDLFQRVECGEQAQHQALSVLESRLNQLETVVGPEVRGVSEKLECVEKQTDCGENLPQNTIGLTQTVDNLQRKVDMLAVQRQQGEQELNLDLTNKINGLEGRIELVASATFTNLQLLDAKVEECSATTQRALDGAATAENKCTALGTELVKVFRMLASRQASPAVTQRTQSPPSCGRVHSPTTTNTVEHSPSPPRNRFPLNRRLQNSRSTFKLGQARAQTGDFARSTMASEMRKVSLHKDVERQEEFVLTDARSPPKEGISTKEQNTQPLIVHQGQTSDNVVQEGEIKCPSRLTDQADDKQNEGTNKCQRTNIRLEAGRIHVNVSHRSGVSTGNRDKRADLVAVQT